MNSKRWQTVFFGIALTTGMVSRPAAALDEAEVQAAVRVKSGKWMQIENDAQKAIKRKAYAEAIPKYEGVLKERQALGLDLLTERQALAECYEKSGQKAKAEAEYKSMIQEREKSSGDENQDLLFPLRSYADFLDRSKRTADAQKLRTRATFIEKQTDKPPKELVALMKSDVADKAELARKAVEIGDVYLNRDQEKRAILCYDKAVESDDKNAEAFAARGEAYRRLEQDGKAKADLDQAIKLNPENGRALFQRAMYYEGKEQKHEALADLDKAVDASPDNTEFLGYRCKLLQDMDELQKAIQGYSRIIKINPKLLWAYVDRGQAYIDADLPAKAAEDFSSAIKLSPDNSDYYELRAKAFTQNKAYAKALEDYAKVIALSPQYTGGYQGRAEVYKLMEGAKSPKAAMDIAKVRSLGHRTR